MYMPTSLGQPQAQTDCSGWESDPQSFVRVIAKHHIRTELGGEISRRHRRVCAPRQSSGFRRRCPLVPEAGGAIPLLHLLLYERRRGGVH